MGQQSLIYAFVARGTVVLAEYTDCIGNFTTIAAQCLVKLPRSNNRSTYKCDGHIFNYLVEDGFTYCVVAAESVGQQTSTTFLERVKGDFTKMYGGGMAVTAGASSLNKEFGSKLKAHMQFCADNPEKINKLEKAEAQVSEVKEVMIENIEKVHDHGHGRAVKIELLVDKTENLHCEVQMGFNVEKGKTLLKEIDTSRNTVKVETAMDFVRNYYKLLNESPQNLHKLYVEGFKIDWPNSDGKMVTVKSRRAAQRMFTTKSALWNEFVMKKISIQTSGDKCMLAVIAGRLTDLDTKIHRFSQTLVLSEKQNGEYFILNDMLMVFEGFVEQVVIIYDEKMTEHCANWNEAPERITTIIDKFKNEGLLQRCVLEAPDVINDDEIRTVHGPGYLEFIKNLPQSTSEKKTDYKGLFDPASIKSSQGTPISLRLSAGGVLKACKLVASGKYDHAFAVVRPPGHHAGPNKADGFCFLNNIALGAHELLAYHHIKRILIVDFDVHHGDGTQSIFINDNRVLFYSTHRRNTFPDPRDKEAYHVGLGEGKGFNINLSLPDNYGDDDLLACMQYVLLPVAKEFNPDIILVSAGYDAAVGDPLGECKVTKNCYGTMIHELKRFPTKGLVLALEGGYCLDALGNCAAACLSSLLGDKDEILTTENYSPAKETWNEILKSRELLSPFWPVLKTAPAPHHVGKIEDINHGPTTTLRRSARLHSRAAASGKDPGLPDTGPGKAYK